jgi:23S rRNA (cytidine1920-2'-O)/16S rRNA (cytidine1409-2'-O)-methyltransferase
VAGGGRPAPERLDQHLVRRGFYETRSQAAAAVLAGDVRVAGSEHPRPGDAVRGEPAVEVRRPPRYASRGGLKLEEALSRWPVAVEDAVCADLGASTGGFTDCLLQHGARRVYAIDVGHGQLAVRLREDPRVVAMDRTNARYLERGALPEAVTLVTADLAFISLTRVVGAIAALLACGGEAVCLVKPQFEAGPERVGRRGVVRDPAVWQDVLWSVAGAFAEAGLGVRAMAPSPLPGPEGNVEFLLWAALGEAGLSVAERKRAAMEATRAAGTIAVRR